MGSLEVALFVATPVRDDRLHIACVSGMLSAQQRFAGSIRFDMADGFMPKARDRLTKLFLDSEATHLLNVDADIGWSADHVMSLLATGKDFVSGTYAARYSQRNGGKTVIPAGVTAESERDGDLVEATFVPGGFLLLSRACVEAMVAKYGEETSYNQAGIGVTPGLWMPILEDGRYFSEDISFCRRWRAMGERIWLHTGVVVDHIGDYIYRPDMKNVEMTSAAQ